MQAGVGSRSRHLHNLRTAPGRIRTGAPPVGWGAGRMTTVLSAHCSVATVVRSTYARVGDVITEVELEEL